MTVTRRDALVVGGILAAGVVGVVAVAAFAKGRAGSGCATNSQCPPGEVCQGGLCVKQSGCDTGFYPCATGVCCPIGDACGLAGGGCPPDYRPDPANPGCCVSTCPSTCSTDTQCAGCGSGFVCESGACAKQLPGFIAGPETLDVPYVAAYQSTGCFVPFCANCAKCNLKINAGTVLGQGMFPAFKFQLLDQTQRPIPNAPVTLASALALGITATLSSATTDANGYVYVEFDGPLFGIPPWTSTSWDGYPCDACSGIGATGSAAVPVGTVRLASAQSPQVYIEPVVTANLAWSEDVNNSLNGCAAC